MTHCGHSVSTGECPQVRQKYAVVMRGLPLAASRQPVSVTLTRYRPQIVARSQSACLRFRSVVLFLNEAQQHPSGPRHDDTTACPTHHRARKTVLDPCKLWDSTGVSQAYIESRIHQAMNRPVPVVGRLDHASSRKGWSITNQR